MTFETSPWRRRVWWGLLAVSLAFNAGIGATIGMQSWRDASAPEVDVAAPTGAHTADDRRHPPRRGRELPFARLQLTDAQRTRFDELRRELDDRSAESRRALRVASDALFDLLAQPEPDPAALSAATDRVADLRATLHRELLVHVQEVRQILEPDQQKEFLNMMRRMLTRGGEPMRDRRRDGRPGDFSPHRNGDRPGAHSERHPTSPHPGPSDR